jgi:hypothetical protein
MYVAQIEIGIVKRKHLSTQNDAINGYCQVGETAGNLGT